MTLDIGLHAETQPSGRDVADRPSTSKKPNKNQRLTRAKIDFSENVPPELLREITRLETAPQPRVLKAKGLTCEKVNEITFKVTDGECTNTPTCHGHWGGYRTTRGVAWVIQVASGQWLARCEDQACGPYRFARAKAAAMTMAAGALGDYQIRDKIRHLNAQAARFENVSDATEQN